MAVPWIQPRPYLFLLLARERTDLEMRSQSLERRSRGHREERVSVQMAELMEETLLQIQEQHRELHQEQAATMNTSTHKQYPKNTIYCHRPDSFYSQKM